ncbi:MAG: hypothetical protein ACRD22_00230 [Terriglobia bacterium]
MTTASLHLARTVSSGGEVAFRSSPTGPWPPPFGQKSVLVRSIDLASHGRPDPVLAPSPLRDRLSGADLTTGNVNRLDKIINRNHVLYLLTFSMPFTIEDQTVNLRVCYLLGQTCPSGP